MHGTFSTGGERSVARNYGAHLAAAGAGPRYNIMRHYRHLYTLFLFINNNHLH